MIVCILTENEILPLYQYVAASMNESIKSGKKFDSEKVMRKLYDTLSKTDSKKADDIKNAKYHAANFVQYAPAFIIDLSLQIEYFDVIDPTTMGELSKLNREFRGENGLNIIIDRFTKKKNAEKIKAEKNTKKENINKPVAIDNEPEGEEPSIVLDETRYKPFSSLKGTLQEYVAVDPTKKKVTKPEQVDKNRVNITSTLRRLRDNLSMSDDGVSTIEYQGEELALKAMPLLIFRKNYDKFLDPTTKAEIAKAAFIIKKGVQKAEVTQPSEQVLIVLTNSDGKILFFDRDGNLTTESNPDAGVVYQFLHDVRKTKEGYIVRDIYNKEDKILSPEEIAEKTFVQEIDKDYAKYLEKVKKAQQAEFEKLYNFKEEVLNTGEKTIEFTGVSAGMSSELNNKTVSFALAASLGITRKDFKTIQTLKKEERGLSKGAAVITLDGKKFQVDRVNVTDSIVDQIVEVLFNKNLTYAQRMNFLDQFIPAGGLLSPSVRRHEWVYDKETEYLLFKTYQYTINDSWEFTRDIDAETVKKAAKDADMSLRNYLKSLEKDGKRRFYVIDGGKTVRQFDYKNLGRGNVTEINLSKSKLNAYTEDYIAESKKNIKNALLSGWKEVLSGNYFPTKMNFNEKLLSDGEYLTYDISTGKFVKKDYLDFVMGLDTTITIKGDDPGIYNNYMNFSLSTPQTTRESKKETITEVESETKKRQKELVKVLNNTPGKSLPATVVSIDNVTQSNKGDAYTITATVEGQEGDYKIYRVMNKPTVGEVFDLVLEDATDGVTVWPNAIKGKKTDSKGYVLDYGVVAARDFNIDPEDKGIPVEQYKATKAEVIKETTVPQAPTPENTNTNASKALRDDLDDLSSLEGFGMERGGKFKKENIITIRQKAKRAKDWWYNSETGKILSQFIELDAAANLVNSNAFADFIVAGATLIEDGKLGKIRINALKGSFIDVYHEAFHVFTQLFLTKEQKIKLYNEVKNYTDANGKQPYAEMSYFEIEEMLAEDFRTYAKNQKPQKNAPVKNSIFRKMWNFLKSLFGKIQDLVPFIKREVIVDSSSVPVVGELFENLYFNNNNFLNNYKPLIENVAFNQLERGLTRVTNKRDQILSESDSDTLVDAIDSIISERIDDIHDKRKAAGQGQLKAGVLAMLTNDANRTKVYNRVKEVLEETLESFRERLYLQPGIPKFSEFDSLEAIKRNAIGVMNNSEGEPKYIFLKSQIDSFENLIGDIKKGQRVKGDLYYDIRIVADFYRHKTLKDGKKSVDIMVVSKPEDAQVQLDNYLKGKAKVYTSVELKEQILPQNLNQEQEFILDNIRILETALSEFGDPLYWEKGEEPTGLIKYHLENSAFNPIRETLVSVEFEGQDDYDDMIEDENGNDILPEEEEGKATDSDLTNDSKVGKYSLLQMAEPRTIYILKSLFAKDYNNNFELDRFGFKKLADFKQTWNTVAKVIGGTQNIEEIYSKLLKAVPTYPILQQLVEYKLPDGKVALNNSFEVDNLVSFWQTFRKPRVPYIQNIYYPIYGSTIDAFTGRTESIIKGYNSKVVYASTDYAKVIRDFQNQFEKSPTTPFIEKINNKSYLNLPAIVRNFRISKDNNNLDTDKALEFANAIGIYLDNTPDIQAALKDNVEFYGLQYIYDIIKDMEAIQQKSEDPNQKVATEALEFLNKFRRNPINTLKGKIPKALLPSIRDVKKDITQENVVNRLASLQAKLGYAALNLGVRNADGNIVFENIEVHSMYSQVDSINQMENLTQAWEDDKFQHMSYLDDVKNTLVKRSVLLNTLFKIDIVGESQYEKRPGRALEIAMDDGSKIAFTSEGTVTADLDPKGLFLQEMNSLLKEGFITTIKLSDKKTTVGLRVRGGIIGDKTLRSYTDDYLYIDTDMFKPLPGQVNKGEQYAIENIIIQHFAAEFDRIKRVKQNREEVQKLKGPNRIVGKDKNGKDLMAAEVFTAFDNILRTTTKEEIYEILPNVEGDVIEYLEQNDPDLLRTIKNEIFRYFKQQIAQNDKLYASKGFFVDEELDAKTGIAPLGDNPTEEQRVIRDTQVKRTLLASYTYNAWIHNFEVTSLFIGDLYQFSGENLHKRNAGSTSGGRGFADSASIRAFINNVFNKGTYNEETGKLIQPKTYAETLNQEENTNKYDNFVYDGKLRTAVIADAERESIYLDEMIPAWKEYYMEEGYSEKEAEELAEKDAEPYRKMTESDGAAFITIDAYRTLKKLENAWSQEQEELYKKVIKGQSLTVKEVKKFFPIYKLQNYGPLHDTIIPAVGMHKFAISPIIPNAVGQSELNKLQKVMLKKNIQYVLFGSGSKLTSVTADGELDNVFANDSQKEIKSEEDIVLTPNVIYTRYLKNVTNVNDKYKKKVVDSTQQRVVITDGLFAEGAVKNPANEKLLNDYVGSVGGYTNTLIAEVLFNIGFIFKNGRYVANKNSLEKFVNVIKSELGKKAVPEHLVKLLGVTLSGSTSMDYSIHPEAATIEKVAVQLIQRKVVNQKVKGEPLIQAPTTFTNGIWDKEAELEVVKDPKQRKKLIGSNNLAFYRRGDYDPKTKTYGPTHLAKTVIAMQGDFENLYNLNDLDGKPIKESADPLATLNALIKNDEWLNKDKNRLSITVMGPRIPNDAHNTIESLEIWHFLDPSYGNTVIVPTEIVAKAGADFDVDKLTLAFPSIASDGKYIDNPLSNKEFKEQLELAQENDEKPKNKRDPKLPSAQALINRQKAALSNQSMALRIKIFKLPENYVRIVKPNAVHLVKKYAENIAQKKEFDKFAMMHDEPSTGEISPTRWLELAYNIDKHEVNTGGGSKAVGIFASNNKLHIQNKQIGVHLPEYYRSTRYNADGRRIPGFLLYPMLIRFPHNTMLDEDGNQVISLSAEKTQKGTNISDLNSHNLQGVLDRAKESFPADLNISPENINMINTLINAGVDEELVLNFINQPLVVEYLKNVQNMSGIYGKITGISPKSKNMIKSEAVRLVIENLQKRDGKFTGLIEAAVNEANDLTIHHIVNVLDDNFKVAIPRDKDETTFLITTGKNLRKGVESGKIPLGAIYKMYEVDENDTPTTTSIFRRTKVPTSESILYFVANFINSRYGQTQFSLEDVKGLFEKQDNSSPKALALFFHYLELEKALRGHQSAQLLFSPDTNYVKTVNQARANANDIEELIESETIDTELFEKFRKKAVIASFRTNELIIDTASTILPLRLNDTISDKIDSTYPAVRNRFPGKDGKELYSTIFNDSVINYIFQNNLSNFLDAQGKVVDIPNVYKKRKVTADTTATKAVIITDNEIVINPDIIEKEFENQYYLDKVSHNFDPESYAAQGLFAFNFSKNPFKRPAVKNALPLSYKSNYIKFLVERELLRVTKPEASLQDDVMYKKMQDTYGVKAYEAYLAKMALMNSFNPNYILGKAEFTYTQDILDVISMISAETRFQIPILNVISEQSQIQTDDKLLQLNDTLDEVNSQSYYRDIVRLGDITVQKSDDPAVNQYITKMFKNFSLYMFYQHGIGYSRLGFNKALDTSSFLLFMKRAANTFLENVEGNDAALTQIFLEIESMDAGRNFISYDSRYDVIQDIEFDDKDMDDDDITEMFLASFGEEVDPESPIANIIENLRNLETKNPFREKDIEMFKASTAFIGFETTANDPVIESKSSTKVYREAFAASDLANKGKYNSTDVVAISGSGDFGRKGQLGSVVSLADFIDQDFKTKYRPEIDRAIEDGVTTFLLGTYNDPRNRQDNNVQNYLEAKGFTAETVKSGNHKYYRFVLKGTQGPVSQSNKPKGKEVKEGIYVNQGALTKEEQLELFDYLKPFLEEQAAKTNKGTQASKMIGLGLRWDYKSNNVGRTAFDIPDVINPGNKTKYGYYGVSINNQPLGQITPRFRELMQKATGVDMTYYDGAIINLYEKNTFISSHNDVDESRSAIKYPVIGINIGGKGNFSIERLGPENAMLDLQAGTGYVFGVDGINREVWHRTFPTPQDSFLPELTTKIDGKTYPAGSYRVTITMRRVMPLTQGMPEAPSIVSESVPTTPVSVAINFEENQTGGYPARTRINASADATIHLADNFETPGEKLTAKSVKEQGKVYRAIETNGIPLNAISKDSISTAINNIVKALNTVNAKSLNIAGNGIYDMKGRTQEEVDKFTYEILDSIVNSPNLKNKITLIRSGGQTGFDEAGAKAGIKLGIPTTVLAPKDWEFRTNQGNIKNEQAFKARFSTVQPTVTSKVKPTIDLSREWKGDLESRPVYTPEGVNTMRTSAAKPTEHFGNPFSEAGYGDTIKVPSIGAAVIAYKEWLLGTNHEDVKPQQRAWILDQINQGKLDGATLLYAGKSAARGQGMHPTALAEVVEQLRSKSTQPTVEPVGVVKTFKNSLFRGQENKPVIDANGNLILVSTYDSLFKSEGVSFAEDLDMARGYGLRYSKNPYIIEIDADYADTIFPLDKSGGTKSYGKRVVGDQGEQRFVSKEDVIIPKGKFKITRKERTFNFETFTPEQLIEAYNKQFIETDVAEYNRYGEVSTGYATEGSDYYDAINKELLRRGISKDDFLFLRTPNAVFSIEEIVADAYNIKAEPGELIPDVSKKQIQEFLNKQASLKDILKKASIAQPTVEPVIDITEQITNLEQVLKELEQDKQEILENSIEGIVISSLPKILPESARKETGLGVGTKRDINPNLLSSKGVTVEKAAELIYGDYFAESAKNITDYDIRNIIIDILSQGKVEYTNDLVNQSLIDSTRQQIKDLKEQGTVKKQGTAGTQLGLFGPEGLPPIKRSRKNCGN